MKIVAIEVFCLFGVQYMIGRYIYIYICFPSKFKLNVFEDVISPVTVFFSSPEGTVNWNWCF